MNNEYKYIPYNIWCRLQNYSLFIWNLNSMGCPVFYLVPMYGNSSETQCPALLTLAQSQAGLWVSLLPVWGAKPGPAKDPVFREQLFLPLMRTEDCQSPAGREQSRADGLEADCLGPHPFCPLVTFSKSDLQTSHSLAVRQDHALSSVKDY